jgi:Citrate synthase
MTFSVPTEDYVINPKIAKAMDRFFILHADHEQNASTSTVRLFWIIRSKPICMYSGRYCLSMGASSRRCQ